MALTLDTITLPQGLRWADEFDWAEIAQSTQYSLTGALIVEQSDKQAGRPITLVGGPRWAWLTRTDVEALKTLLNAGAAMTLTLHDARTFTVLPADEEPLKVSLLPRVHDAGPANPSSAAWYVLESLTLIEV